MSRKAMGLIAALAAVVGLMTFAGSAQAAPNTVWVEPPSQTVAPNEVGFTVDIMAEAPAGLLGSWDIHVLYDGAVLDATACLGVAAGAVDCNPDFAAGEASFNGFNANGLTGVQTLGTLTFTAIGASGTSSDLTITVVAFTDGQAVPTNPTTTPGTVLIQTPTPSPTPSPTPLATPTPTPTAAATASPTRTATPAQLPATGGTASDGSGSDMAWVLGFLGLAVLAGGVWAVSRTRRESM